MMTLRRPPRRGFVGNLFTPAECFRGGVNGVWFDFSDLGTMFQDSAGTTPVTAADQPVGKVLDKSGNGNHASQATDSKRPMLRSDGRLWWLEFDGVDDCFTHTYGSGSNANLYAALVSVDSGSGTWSLIFDDGLHNLYATGPGNNVGSYIGTLVSSVVTIKGLEKSRVMFLTRNYNDIEYIINDISILQNNGLAWSAGAKSLGGYTASEYFNGKLFQFIAIANNEYTNITKINKFFIGKS